MTFEIIVCGSAGGPVENNLSCYLVRPLKEQNYIALDAGSLLGGIEVANRKDAFSELVFKNNKLKPSIEILCDRIDAYLLSHTHLDHVLGLVINTQIEFHGKEIFGFDQTIDHLRDHLFNGKIWANFGNEGDRCLNRFVYRRVQPNSEFAVKNFKVTALPLHHPKEYLSTAFLIEYGGQYLLYFGDTSSDKHEEPKYLLPIWKKIAPLIDKGVFAGMILECSYPMIESKKVSFGHLDTKLMEAELEVLASCTKRSLAGLKVVVSHRKEGICAGDDPCAKIEQELTQTNKLGINYIFPMQGDRILL